MPITPERLMKLREFGLSEYAARAYLALLDLGISEARDVSSISKVPQAKIYHVLDQLHEKGLVVVLPEFPKKYGPVPFSDYLDRLFDEHNKAAQTIESEREELAEVFRVVGDTDVGNRGFFTVIRGRRNVLSKIEELADGAAKDLLVLGTAGSAHRAPQMLHVISRARERGVRVRFMAPIEPDTLAPLQRVASAADVRARDLAEEEQSRKVAIVVADAARAFLIHFVPDDANVYAGKDIGVFTDQEAMVAAIRAIVEPHWTRAATFAQRQAEIRGMRPPEATRVVEPSEWDAALRAAAAHARRDARVALGEPLHDVSEAERVLAALPEGVPVRLLVNVDGPKAAEAARALVRPGVEVRHAAPRLALRKVLLDDREAFFSVGASGVVVHTNAAPALASLGESFARGWETAMPLDARVRELEVFPELRPGELGLGSLFDLLDDAVVVARRDGRIVLWSPSATRLFGVPPADALRRSLDKIVEPAHAEGLRRALARAATERVLVESACARPDGAPLQVEWALTPLAGRADLVIALGRDVTRRETARQAELRAHMEIVHVYERMTDAFLALDKGWRIVYRNPAVRRFQRTKTDAEIDGQVLWDAFPELRGTRYEAEYRRAMREMVPVHFTERYEPLGKTFEVNAYPSEDGLTVYFRDVTARADVPVQDKDEAPRARKRA